MRTGCSTPSSPPNPAAWVWDSRSAVRSWQPTMAGCGPRQTYPTVPRFSSACRRTQILPPEIASISTSKEHARRLCRKFSSGVKNGSSVWRRDGQLLPQQQTFHDRSFCGDKPSPSDQAPPMQRAAINQLSNDIALPNRSCIVQYRRKSRNIVAGKQWTQPSRSGPLLKNGALTVLFRPCSRKPPTENRQNAVSERKIAIAFLG